MSVSPGSSAAEVAEVAYALPIFTAADFLHSAITLLENDAVRNPQRDPSVYLCVRCLRRVTRFEGETGVGWPELLLPDDCTTLPDPAVDLFNSQPATPASSPIARPSSCPPLRVVDFEDSDYADHTEITLGTDTQADGNSDPSSDTPARARDPPARATNTSAHPSDTSAHPSDTSVHPSDTSAHSPLSSLGQSLSSLNISAAPSPPPAVPRGSPPSYSAARRADPGAANDRPTVYIDPPPYSLPGAASGAVFSVRSTGPFSPGWDPLVPWISPPSSSATWYVVTVGRRVGVFDSRIDATTATRGVACDNSVAEYSTRAGAVADFTSALRCGTVHVIRLRD